MIDDTNPPAIGDVYKLITASSVSGVFDSVTGVSIGDIDGMPAALAVLYDATTVLVMPSILGDTDLDFALKTEDATALIDAFGSGYGATWIQGDLNGDGWVDVTDAILMRNAFNATGQTAPAELVALIPEPMSCLLLGIGSLVFTLPRRSRPFGS